MRILIKGFKQILPVLFFAGGLYFYFSPLTENSRQAEIALLKNKIRTLEQTLSLSKHNTNQPTQMPKRHDTLQHHNQHYSQLSTQQIATSPISTNSQSDRVTEGMLSKSLNPGSRVPNNRVSKNTVFKQSNANNYAQYQQKRSEWEHSLTDKQSDVEWVIENTQAIAETFQQKDFALLTLNYHECGSALCKLEIGYTDADTESEKQLDHLMTLFSWANSGSMRAANGAATIYFAKESWQPNDDDN